MNKSYQEYLKEINDQTEKPIKEQISDMKSAGAHLLMALDKVICTIEPMIEGLDDHFDPNKVTCSIDGKEVDCDKLGEER